MVVLLKRVLNRYGRVYHTIHCGWTSESHMLGSHSGWGADSLHLVYLDIHPSLGLQTLDEY